MPDNWYFKYHFSLISSPPQYEFQRVDMRLTAFTDFGLRALMRLAGEPDRSFSTHEIAAEFGISRNHLIKIVRDLAESGYVITQRGAGGGFRLARPARSITLGEVVRTLEQDQALVECFRDDGGSCVLTPRCRLKLRLAKAREAFLKELDATTLAECAYPRTSKSMPTRGAA
jgi:Rrf2 family nitric oxide-sensitive transcriptional repressor